MGYSTIHCLILSWILLLPLAVIAEEQPAYSEGGSEQCLSCHDFSKDSPVHPMMQGAHGDLNNPETPMAQKGCEHCHGPSAKHILSPTSTKPAVSFGPKWSDGVAEQSGACLQCHQSNTAHNWPTALHQRNNLTCATCHDLHVADQAVLNPATQADVCMVCHKVQKKGVHHLEQQLGENPPCVVCHDPHADPSPVVKLLQNRSEGCRHCHDFRAMQMSPAVSDQAKQYHKAMANKDKTCIDCHFGVSHSPPNSFPPPRLGGLVRADVPLFYPGQSDVDWILSGHAGAQSFRQGRNCLQCHDGDQAAMGAALADKGQTASIESSIDFALQSGVMTVAIRWKGDANDAAVSLMLDDGSDEDFGRAGCWATCHSDLPAMTKNKGQQLTKYLAASRLQQKSIGRPALVKDQATLNEMLNSGHAIEMWRANLNSGGLGNVETASILAQRKANPSALVNASANYNDGVWNVVFRKPLTDSGKAITSGKTYTFGYAIHGNDESGAKHWVSLPMTFSLDSIDSDFIVK